MPLAAVGYLDNNIKIDKENLVELHGIANIPVYTLGSVRIKLFGKQAVCHVVPDEMPIPHAGLVGSEFFATHGAKIDYENKIFEIDNQKYPFKQANRVTNGVMYIPPRSESTFYVKVNNPQIREGYIPKLKLCKGVFAGSCLVSIRKNRAYLQVYNTTEDEVAVRIPTLTTREIERIGISPTVDQEDLHKSHGVTKRIFNIVQDHKNLGRFKKIKPLLRLEYLHGNKIEGVFTNLLL
ncbi:hypothetical protein KQX54_002791 [Cotesia glomerata]|uniref:Uncharacterized protein n=1 Tax=Cotesia glomerata TaxID=32391 RepID=A0AAV7IKZ2_COTGL|nr:hypothetical protein KQX54_002791 [Cotesia glomerata]